MISTVKATTMDREREQVLIRDAKRGNRQAFAELYDANVDAIYRYIYARVFVKHVAEDLTADVFMNVLESLPKYEDRSTPILAWMYRIAHAQIVDYYRLSQKNGNHADIDTVEVGVSPDLDDALVDASQAEILQAALLNLTEEQQQVIMLRFVEGHNLETTAQLLGKKVSAVKSLQFRAIQALGRMLPKLKSTTDE
jgi:RNA polymerase sigma-70 factor, ECF subfamily